MITVWLAHVVDLPTTDGTISDVVDPTQEKSARLPLLEGARLAALSHGDVALFDQAVLLLGRRLVWVASADSRVNL